MSGDRRTVRMSAEQRRILVNAGQFADADIGRLEGMELYDSFGTKVGEVSCVDSKTGHLIVDGQAVGVSELDLYRVRIPLNGGRIGRNEIDAFFGARVFHADGFYCGKVAGFGRGEEKQLMTTGGFEIPYSGLGNYAIVFNRRQHG